jgi:polypeptide N-acetylgalactosaminyltransferase
MDYLFEPLQYYVRDHFPEILFKIIHLKKRSGVSKARVVGAQAASSEFLFLMEPHIELGYNWLPPLLEPVYLDEKTVTVPIIDYIEYTELKIIPNYPSRGIFDWNLEYKQLPRLPHTEDEETIPYKIPVMTGGIFLIRKSYFMELGPYDESLIIWGAENLEMSFKLNLCGGNLIEIPCSRMAHMFRNFNKFRKHEKVKDFVPYNKKRVAEV